MKVALMIFQDRVYGEIKIDEPVILEIIETPEFERLKGVDQAGYFSVHFPDSEHNRFEHSLGVYELLRRYGASKEEQIAGLLHDISHSVFSHTIDYIVHDGSGEYQCHQDKILPNYLKNSSIAKILEKYKFDINRLIDDSNFPLKENELPDICADRIDYSLRGFLVFNIVPKEVVDYFLRHLKASSNRWFFDDLQSAERYANLFKELNSIYYSGPQSAHMFRTTAEYLKRALDYGYINDEDLYTTDTAVLNKIKTHHNRDLILQKLFLRMENKVRWEINKDNYDFHVLCKSRAIDPFYQVGESFKRVSESNPNWKQIVTYELKPKEHFIKFYD